MKIGNKTFSDDCFASVADPITEKRIFKSKCPKSSDFGKEVRRPYEVSDICYDCKKFVNGCKGWAAKREFTCSKIQLCKQIEAGVK